MARFYPILACATVAAGFALLPVSSAEAATTSTTVSASFLKPLVLTAKQGLNFGQVVLPTSGSSVTLSINRTGVLTCPAALTCSGSTSQAIFNAAGSNNQTVKITVPAVTLTNGTGGILTMTPDVVASIFLTNSGAPGTDFGVGGSIIVSPTTPDGNYTGTLTVTADYQ